jgi:hypothetical protein
MVMFVAVRAQEIVHAIDDVSAIPYIALIKNADRRSLMLSKHVSSYQMATIKISLVIDPKQENYHRDGYNNVRVLDDPRHVPVYKKKEKFTIDPIMFFRLEKYLNDHAKA